MLPTFSVNIKTAKAEILSKVAGIERDINLDDRNRQWAGEAYINAVEGKNNSDVMNLSGYSRTCEKNSKISQNKKKEVRFVTQEEVDEGCTGLLDIADTTVDTIEDSISGLDVEYYVEEFIRQREIIFFSRGSDIWRLFDLTRQGDIEAGNKLRTITDEYNLGDMIKYIVRNSRCQRRLDQELC